jgi:hypothetical protein
MNTVHFVMYEMMREVSRRIPDAPENVRAEIATTLIQETRPDIIEEYIREQMALNFYI